MIGTLEKVLFLKRVDLFQHISAEDLAHLALIADEYPARPGEVIFHQGDRGDCMYLIVEGQVKVHTDQTLLAQLGTNQCFGEMAILDEEPRSATVTALTPLILLRIQRDDFMDILAEKPDISRGVIIVLTRRLRAANRR